MIPYFIILTISMLLAITADKLKSLKKISNFFVVANAVLLILFAGLRNESVGTDTSGYVSSFLYREHVFSKILNGTSTIEIGYQFLQTVAHSFSNNYYSILLSIAFIFIFFSLKGIYKISIIPSVSIFVFITFGIYTFIFNGARQGIALGIFIYAIQFIINKQFRKYALFIGIGFLFHKSIIITLPFYFLFRLKFTAKLFILLIIATSIVILMFNNVLSIGLLISNKYIIYTELKAKGGEMLTIAYIIFGIFFILVKPMLNKVSIPQYDIYLNIYLIGPIIFFIVQFTGAYIEITRLAIYFLSSAIFIWPIILKNINYRIKPVVFIFFIASNLTFFYIFINRIGDLVPYKFHYPI